MAHVCDICLIVKMLTIFNLRGYKDRAFRGKTRKSSPEESILAVYHYFERAAYCIIRADEFTVPAPPGTRIAAMRFFHHNPGSLKYNRLT